ncbi:hypothetical protein M2132_002392, partial [Dysgonomonas sp. PH5-45]|nr:hypothetical protein [Dysgonomonas sp. PH5-45]MDH6388921.1 hypothetical protein [Dysgonomonas sp. PH5-37]
MKKRVSGFSRLINLVTYHEYSIASLYIKNLISPTP